MEKVVKLLKSVKFSILREDKVNIDRVILIAESFEN